MKVLTICQPYAHLIVIGRKTVEFRPWCCHYRGPLLIHAGKSRSWLEAGDEVRNPGMAFGAIVGRAVVTGCGRDDPDEAWGIALDNVERLTTPIPYRGQQGLYNVPDSVLSGAVWETAG